MPTNSDWGMGWAVAAYAVTWGALLLYTRYVIARARHAHEALAREARRAGGDR